MAEELTRILVPVDFSVHADKALRYAATLAGRFNATVELLHVVEDPYRTGAWSPDVYTPVIPEILDNLVADARRRLEDMKVVAAAGGVDVRTDVLIGLPAHSIIEKSTDFDLIVMGTHGRTGLPHIVTGSVAERVVRKAACPVLTVRDTHAAVKSSDAHAA